MTDNTSLSPLQRRNSGEERASSRRRQSLTGLPHLLSLAIGTSLMIFTFASAVRGVFVPMVQRSVHLYSILALIFLWYPARSRAAKLPDRPEATTACDIILSVLCLVIMAWVLYNSERLMMRIAFISDVSTVEMTAGAVTLLLVMESVRRTVGLTMIVIACVFIIYALIGPLCPGILMHKGMSASDICDQLFMTTEGFFGSLTGTSATVICCFVAFGVFLSITGADRYFIRLCMAAAGGRRGGPAKVAVLSSALFGCISGSTIANVVTTGTITIPMMKKAGYEPHIAAATETAASAAGQIMPPVMGTSIFIMAEILGMKYLDIVKISYIPAILYFASVWFFVDTYAASHNLQPCTGDEQNGENERGMIIMLSPIVLLIAMMANGYTPFLSGFISAAAVAVLGVSRRMMNAFCASQSCRKTEHREDVSRLSVFHLKTLSLRIRQECSLGLRSLTSAFERCALNMCSITATIACAAVMIALINKTGLMLKMTAIMLRLGGGSMIITIAILAVLAYFLGTALPVSTCYVLLATLGASAMVKLGISQLNAHMMIQWFTQLATITPPVCLTAYAAANIARSDPMRTGYAALKLGLGFYYIPMLFVFTNILTGSLSERTVIGCTSLLSIYMFVSASEKGGMRIAAMIAAAALYVCSFSSLPMTARISAFIIGICLAAAVKLRRAKTDVQSSVRPQSGRSQF